MHSGRAYHHALIDNYSRRILAGRVIDHFDPGVTARLFLDASKAIAGGKPTVLVDGGSENDNPPVDEAIESGLLKRALTQAEIVLSNRLIVSGFR